MWHMQNSLPVQLGLSYNEGVRTDSIQIKVWIVKEERLFIYSYEIVSKTHF